MKKIVETCNQNTDGSYLKDSVKLRLRGKGSGYKEGPSKQGININSIINSSTFKHLNKNFNLYKFK